MLPKYRFETLLALSDLLVLTACQRAHVRRKGRSAYVGPRDLHRAYEAYPVPDERLDASLADAWVLCPMLATRNHIEIDSREWAAILDGYTRALLLMGMPHSMHRLRETLTASLSSAGRGTLRVAR